MEIRIASIEDAERIREIYEPYVTDTAVSFEYDVPSVKEDEHLTNDSESFHTRMGFKLSAKHERCGYKFGKWYSVIWMDKDLVEKPAEPEDFISFSQLVDCGIV